MCDENVNEIITQNEPENLTIQSNDKLSYYQRNREKRIEYQKQYYNKNIRKEQKPKRVVDMKEYFQEYYSIRKEDLLQEVKCEICNKFVTKANLLRHNKSLKHLMKMNKFN